MTPTKEVLVRYVDGTMETLHVAAFAFTGNTLVVSMPDGTRFTFPASRIGFVREGGPALVAPAVAADAEPGTEH